MNNESNALDLITPRTSSDVTPVKRSIVLMGESSLGEKIGGSKYFETGHGVFLTVKDAELYGESNIKHIRWLVGERIEREGEKITYDFKSKPRSPRGE